VSQDRAREGAVRLLTKSGAPGAAAANAATGVASRTAGRASLRAGIALDAADRC